MKYEKLYNLDTLELAFYAIERQMRAAAYQHTDGRKVVPASVWYNDAQRLCMSLQIEQGGSGRGHNLTPVQIAEYFNRHNIGCTYISTYKRALDIFHLYGAIMFELIKYLIGKKKARRWLKKWHAGENSVLVVFEQAAAADENPKYELASLHSYADLTQPQPLKEFADAEHLKAEAMRIAQELTSAQEAAATKPQEKALPDALHEPSMQDIAQIAQYCDVRYTLHGCFQSDRQRVLEELAKPRGKKAAFRIIRGIFDDKQKVVQVTKASGSAQKPRLTWELWRKLWGQAFGVSIPYRYESK